MDTGYMNSTVRGIECPWKPLAAMPVTLPCLPMLLLSRQLYASGDSFTAKP